MVTVRRVETKKDIKEFIEFPLRLYRGCKQFVPPLYMDEKKLLTSGGSSDIAKSVFFIAEKDGKTVGRIQGILHKQYNEIRGKKRVRFNRFDSYNDTEISRALFGAVEDWARAEGMTETCGPLGFSDLDREGLLVEGFDEDSTFEEQYNYEYYVSLIEDAGYSKEVDWLEFELRKPEKRNEMLSRVAARALEMNKLHIAPTNVSKKAYIEKYADSFFECLDECYSKLYGTVPLTKAIIKKTIDDFIPLVNLKYICTVKNAEGRIVAFGVMIPSIAKALKQSDGKLYPFGILRLMRALQGKNDTLEMFLVAVDPDLQSCGIPALIINTLLNRLIENKVKYCETGPMLETNVAVHSLWSFFEKRQHKRRRCYVKTI